MNADLRGLAVELDNIAQDIEHAGTAGRVSEIAAQLERLSVAQGQGWLPIESAPKDGRMFLVWMDAVRCGEDDDGGLMELDASECDFAVWRESEHGGYVDAMSSPRAEREQATHWQPLPAAPAQPDGVE